MRVDRQINFARLEGKLIKYGVPSSDGAWITLKKIEATVGNMSAEQIGLVEHLIEQIVVARNRVSKEKMIATINALELSLA